MKDSNNKTDAEEIERFADKIIERIPENNIIPIEQVILYKNMLFHPNDTIKKITEKNEGVTFKDGLMNVLKAGFVKGLITGAISGAIMIIISIVLLGVGIILPHLLFMGVIGIIIGISSFVVSTICTPIISSIGWILINGLMNIFAKLLGGTGDYNKQSYLTSLVTSGVMITGILLIPFTFIPFINYIASLISFVIGIYGIYLYYKIVRKIHKLSLKRGVLSIILTYFTVILLVLVMVALIYILFYVFIFMVFMGLANLMIAAKASTASTSMILGV
ncbi:YIP1 family protein [Candidatus Micrarchaeota archaeon]|nr:YIP1 family protein [Candidatus Micrarchaeota archaeon]